MTAALDIDGLTAGYGDAMVLRRLRLAVAAREVVAVLGKNGMGKTTLLKAVMGFLPAREGRVRLLAEDTTGLPPYRLAARGIAYSPQSEAIFQDLTVAENLRLGRPRGTAVEAAGEWFPVLGQRLRQRAGTLSGGEQKMLVMARALLARPRLLLVDEISEGLQPSVILRLADVLRRANREDGAAILLIEQNIPFALSLAARYAVLTRGEIVDEGGAAAPGADARIAAHLAV